MIRAKMLTGDLNRTDSGNLINRNVRQFKSQIVHIFYMEVRMKKQIFLLAVVTTLTSFCFAQEKPTAKKEQHTNQKQARQQLAIKFSLDMLESDRIDPKYTGFPVAEVISAIEKLVVIKKGEFESTADFNARKTNALTAKFLGGSRLEDTFAFVVSVTKDGSYSDEFQYKFDPDSGKVNLYVLPKSSEYVPLNGVGAPDYQNNQRESKGLDQFILSSKIESQRAYRGSNAYGATVTVKEINSSSAGIAVNRISFLAFDRGLDYPDPVIASQFKLENARAAAELSLLKALVVMRLSDPYVVYNFSHKKPTRSSPTDSSMQEKYLTGDVLGIIYYSGRTGEIFARLPNNFGERKAISEPESK